MRLSDMYCIFYIGYAIYKERIENTGKLLLNFSKETVKFHKI
jgi:hypothetical protein